MYFFMNGAFLLFSILIAAQQTPLQYDACSQCDGKAYYKSYAYFSGQTPTYNVTFPFHSRVFVPWCLSFWSGEDLAEGFWYFNLLFTLLAVNALLYLWGVLGISVPLQFIGFSWLLFHWVGIVRYNQLDWITVDVPLYFFQTLLLIFILKKWYALLLPLAVVATLQKESFIPLLGLFCVWQCYEYYQNKSAISLWAGLALVLAVFTKTWTDIYFPAQEGTGKSSVITILFFVRETLKQPLDIVRLGVAFFTAYGGWACLALVRFEPRFFKESWMRLLLLYSALFLAFGLLAGRDMTRIVFLGFPFVMTLILLILSEEDSWLRYALAALFSVPVLRLLSEIPSSTGTGAQAWQNWYPEFAEMGMVSAWGLYFWVAFWILSRASLSRWRI